MGGFLKDTEIEVPQRGHRACCIGVTENLLEMQVLGPRLRPAEQNPLGKTLRPVFIEQALQVTPKQVM